MLESIMEAKMLKTFAALGLAAAFALTPIVAFADDAAPAAPAADAAAAPAPDATPMKHKAKHHAVKHHATKHHATKHKAKAHKMKKMEEPKAEATPDADAPK